MKKGNKIAWMSASTLLCAALIAGCGTQNATNNTAGNTAATGTAAKSQPQLVMATSADFPPYEFHDMSSGTDQIKGFDIDIANQIAKDLGFTFTIKDMNFDGLIGALQSGRADFVFAGMTPTPAREKNVDFSELYYTSQNAIVERKGANLTAASQLAGKKIGVETGSTQEQFAKTIKGATIVSLDQVPSVIEELKTGRIDAAILENTVAKGFLQNNPDLD